MININKSRIIVLGAARSGLAVAKLLSEKGATVFVSDIAAADEKKDSIEFLKGLGVLFEFGEHSEKIFQADFVVLSPGISPATEIVQKIRKQNIPVFSEIEVASWFCTANIIAVTGSNGKTTTTTLLGDMLRTRDADAIVAGNIGTPLSLFVSSNSTNGWAAVEISSFQLETIEKFHPKIAILLNLSPNHLDWYPTFEDYVNAKMRILINLTQDDFIIYNYDDDILRHHVSDSPARLLSFSLYDQNADGHFQGDNLYLGDSLLINKHNLRIRGEHNYANSLAAGLAAQIAGISPVHIARVLANFSGVVHRLEFVKTVAGVHFINDSKATTLESQAAALRSFENKIILIAGGKDKGSDFSQIADLLKQKVRTAILIGQARNKIYDSWKNLIPLHIAETLENAVHFALEIAKPGEYVVLSPACSSFDMFKDYEERGDIFKKIIHELKNETHKIQK
jgi:UDP-N-acetylmuramoylalanine--D-glutamate ligase